ncbi:NAD(P)H-binding protein [Plantactinospora sp. WMMB334]|uniref:NAD(P)H-binding protein n=1 Tax=Plantactinospora sp. WMMB334 TaxID=3404119 RepID=UPI003B922ECB
MTVLIIGASGNTGGRLARQLAERGIPVRRAGRAATDVRFDWTETSTFEPAVRGVRAVYLVSPIGVLDPEPVVLPFLAAAQRAGVARIVLLSSSAVPVGGPGPGRLGALLPSYVPEWTVLRPTWFASNFTGRHMHARSARETGEIVSATGAGRVPFIDPEDIATVARHALTDAEASGRAPVLTGPEPLSFDEVAASLSVHLCRTVRHRQVDAAELARRHRTDGLPAEFADLLAGMDAAIAAGAEDRTTTAVQDITGRPPRHFADFLADSTPCVVH